MKVLLIQDFRQNRIRGFCLSEVYSVKVLLIQDFWQNRIRGFCLSEVYSVKVLLIQDFHTAATVHPHSGRTGCRIRQNRIRGFCLSEVYKWIFGHYNILSRLRKS